MYLVWSNFYHICILKFDFDLISLKFAISVMNIHVPNSNITKHPMTRFKQHLWLLGIFFTLQAFATNTHMPTTHPPLADEIRLHISSARANVGDVIPIDFKVGNFKDIDFINGLQVNWNSSFLEFVNIEDGGFGVSPITNFDVTNASTGRAVLAWRYPSTPLTLGDSTVFFRINFKVKAYSSAPVQVFIPSAVITQSGIGQVSQEFFSGYVTIANPGLCASKAAGLTCANATYLCLSDFPYCNFLPKYNEFKNLFPASCGGTENAHFFQFDAASTDISFKVSASNCTGGPGPNPGNGVQFRIFKTTDCLTFTRIVCESVFPSSVDVFTANGLTIGDRYLLMVDGVTNDVCDYKIEITSGTVGNSPSISPSEIIGIGTTCPNQTGLAYSINRPDATGYEWRVDGGGTITAGQGTKNIQVTWGSTVGKVCVKVKSTCGESPFACKDIAITTTTPTNRTETVCPGGSAKIGTEVLTKTDFYTRTLKSITGCDSVVNLNLTVLLPAQLTENVVRKICAGDSVKIGNQVFKATQNYTIPLPGASYLGCDSTVKLTLTVVDSVPGIKNLDRTVCPTGSVSIGGTTYNKTGKYRVVLSKASVTGCDSIVNLNLVVLTAAQLTETITRKICTGDSVKIGNQVFKTPVTNYPVNLPNYLGCDSTVILTLTVINAASATFTITKTICAGDSVVIRGKVFKTTNANHTVIIPNGSFSGCDSTIVLNLTVLDVTVSASKSSDITCTIKNVTLAGSAIVSPSAAVFTIEWKDASATVFGTNPSVSVAQGGIFTLKVTAKINGVTCEKTTTVTVTKSGGLPSRPELLGDVVTCENRTVTYNIVNPPATGVSKYNWTIQGGTIVSGANTASVSVNWGLTGKGKICVNAENGCGTSDSTCLDVKIGKIPSSSTILGDSLTCPRSTATYYTNDTLGISDFQWTVPLGATILRGQGTKQIDVGWSTNAGGSVCLTPSNLCGSGAQKCLNVTVNLAPPDSMPLTGLKTFCPGTIDTLRVKLDSTVTKFAWRTSSNVTILNSLTSKDLIVRYDNGTDALFFLDIENKCGIKRTESHYVKIRSEPPAALIFSGNRVLCSTDTTKYSVIGNNTIASYKWSVSTGASILGGQGSQEIRVAWDTVTLGQVCIELTLAGCAVQTNDCYEVKVKQAAVDTFSILGNAKPCPGSTAMYAVTPNPRIRIHKWTVPANGTIVKGQDTGEIEIKWANSITTGTLCLDITNDCGTTRRECFKIDVKPNIDSLPLTGIKEICEGATATFTAQKDTSASAYTWTLPTGSTITSGQGTNQIKVLFGGNSGSVKVQTTAGCAAGPSAINVLIKNAPDAPASITGSNIVCQGETVSYKAASVLNIKSYKWKVPSGAILVGSDSADVVTVRWAAATNGKLTVKTRSECFESLDKTLDVSVNRLPTPKAGVDDSICDKLYALKGVLSVGVPEWRVIQKPNASLLTFADSSKANSTLTANKSGIYLLALTEKNGQCVVSDTVSLFIRESPQLTLVNDNCNATSTQFSINVAIKGNAPFSTFSGTTGAFLGTNFTTVSLPENSTYSVTVKDAFGCPSNTLSGIKVCPCVTQTAVLRNTPLVACLGQKAKIDVETKANLDADDTFEYILHDGTPTTLGTILQSNKTGEFDFMPTKMQFDRTYYIQYRVGNNNNGAVITTDRCFKASNSIPVVFKGKITVGISGDTAICANSSAVLKFYTNSTDAFDISLRNDKENITVNLNNIRNSNTATVSPSVSATYRLSAVNEKNGCPTEILDSAKISIRKKMFGDAGLDQTVCIKTGQLTAVIPPQYSLNWRSVSGADIVSSTSTTTAVSNLKNGRNSFILTTSDSVCTSYRSFDTVSIYLPTSPKALNLSLEMFMGDTLKSDLSESSPPGTYSVTRLTNPATGRFDVFSSGAFNYISNPNYTGVAKFKFMVCSEACTGVCDTGEVRILIKPKPVKIEEIKIDVPNAITPNDDGKNDVLIIDNIEKFPQAELTIFNRWGDVLYIGKNYRNTWNGTNQKGDPLPEGTYYYILRLNLNDGKILRGDMTILR
jgi:gliding motility-associated-like protein